VKKKMVALLLIVGLLVTVGCMDTRFAAGAVQVAPSSSIIIKSEQIDVNNHTRSDVVDILGDPINYIWGESTFTEDDLPEAYIMTYSDGLDIEIVNNKIQELRYYTGDYVHSSGVTVGMSLQDVLEAVGEPVKELVSTDCYYTPGILYKDINGDEGRCYYDVKDLNVRMFFKDYSVNCVYVTNDVDLFEELAKEFKKKIASGEIESRTDDIDLPFLNDEKVIGVWESVDFVRELDQFSPGSKYWAGGLYLENLVFKPEGEFEFTMEAPWEGTWTKGNVLNTVMVTASAYEIVEIDGEEYMFFEWKSGDYVYRGMTPFYYVMKKVDE